MKTLRFLAAFIVIAMVFAVAAPVSAQANVPSLCSGVQLQNATTSDATNVSMDFYATTNSTGTADYSYPVAGGLAANASKSFYIPSTLPSSVPDGIYSVVVNSSQQLNSLVNESKCEGATGTYVVASHSGVQASQVSGTVYLGYVLSRAYVGQSWSSVVAIQNAGTAIATDIKIEFFKSGSSAPVETFTVAAPGLQPGVTWYLDLSSGPYATDALNGFFGAAKITSAQTAIAAVANYAPGIGESRLLSYNGVTSTSQTLYATQITKNAYSQVFNSGISLYNPNGTDTPISMKFYKSGESAPTCTINDTIASNAAYSKYMGSIVGACNGGGTLPDGFNGYLVINVTSGTNGILGIFNFNSVSGGAGAANMIRGEDAATTLYFPQILRRAYSQGYNSGFQIVNTGSTALTLTFTYTGAGGTGNFSEDRPLAGNSAVSVYVGDLALLPLGWNGGLVVTVQGAAGKIVGQGNINGPTSFGGDMLSVYNAFTP